MEVDAEVDLHGREVIVVVTVRFSDALLLKERFEWTIPVPGRPAMLIGHAAKRHDLANGVS